MEMSHRGKEFISIAAKVGSRRKLHHRASPRRGQLQPLATAWQGDKAADAVVGALLKLLGHCRGCT